MPFPTTFSIIPQERSVVNLIVAQPIGYIRTAGFLNPAGASRAIAFRSAMKNDWK